MPNFLNKNKKTFLAATLVFFIVGGIFILGAPKAHALGFLDAFTKPGDFIITVIAWLFSIIAQILSLLLTLAANLVETVLSMSKMSGVAVVNQGWQITRGLCNMFFALILLVMAIATILQIESFGAKKLLVRLVTVALLINFSLLFAGILVDFSQVLTSYFVDAAKGTNGQGISAQLMNGLSIGRAVDANPASNAVPNYFCGTVCSADQICTRGFGDLYQCAPAPSADTNPQAQVKPGIEEGGGLKILIGSFFSVVIILIATFSLLAAAVFLVFRIVALWLLLIFVPLACLSWITGTGGLWKIWLNQFIKWTFFAPIYTFFIYLGIMIASSGSLATTMQGSKGTGVNAEILNGLVGSDISFLLQYIVIVIVLLGGLYVAQRFSILGAKTISGWGKSAAKWTTRKTTGYDKWAPALMSAGGSVVARIPLLKKVGGEMKGKSIEMKEKQLQRRENQLYDKFVRKLPETEVQDLVKKGGGIKGLIASRVAYEKGYLKNADRETVQKAMETFKNFGMQKELQQLQEMRVDAIVNPAEMEQAFKRALDSGAYKSWSAAAFEGEKGKKLMNDLQGNLSRGGFISAYSGWTKSTKDTAKATMRANFNNDSTNDFQDKDEIYRRDIYAAATDDITDAYKIYSNPSDVSTGELKPAGKGETAAAIHIRGRNAAQLGAVGPGKTDMPSMKLIGKYITEQQLTSIRGELGAVQKQYIAEGAKDNQDIKVKVFLENSPAWGGRAPAEEKPRGQAGFRPS